MSAPGSTDSLGQSHFKAYETLGLKVPCTQPPTTDGERPVPAGSKTDMGALVLFLVSNWFVNGETVLIDGGVRVDTHHLVHTLIIRHCRPFSSTRRRSKL